MNRSSSSQRLLMFLLVTALACSGCRVFFDSPGPAKRISGMIPLDGEELVLGAAGPGEGHLRGWITSEKRLTLRYLPVEAGLPHKVVYLYREAGREKWILGPAWHPGSSAVTWSPPWEGRWELRAEVYDGPEPKASAAWQDPHAVVAFDWTAPRLAAQRPLPEGALEGGDKLVLSWSSRDDFPGADSVALEIQAGLEGQWEHVADLPNTGYFEWQVPNRPLAGAKLRLRTRDAAGNSSFQQVPGRLTVESVEPVIEVPGQMSSRDETVRVPYTTEVSMGSEVTRVELWTTLDQGANWSLAGYDADLRSPIELELSDGNYGIRVVIVDSNNNRNPYPLPGEKPKKWLVVDRQAPTFQWGDAQVQTKLDKTHEGLTMVEVRLPYELEDPNLDASSVEFQYRTGDGMGIGLDEWTHVAWHHQANGVVTWEIPERSAEPLWVRVSGQDKLGNTFSDEVELYPREVLHPPVLAFENLPSGWLRGGDTVEIRWRAEWEWAQPESLGFYYRIDGGHWQTVAEKLDLDESIDWQLPKIDTDTLEIKLVLRSIDKRELVTSVKPFSLDSAAPTVSLVGPSHGWGTSVQLLAQTVDQGGSGIDHFELYAAREGSEKWEYMGTAPGEANGKPTDRIEFTPPAVGAYRMWVVAVDRAGNRSASAEEVAEGSHLALVVDKEPPGIVLSSFQDGGAFSGGSTHIIFLDWRGPNSTGGTVDVEYSLDNGSTWENIERVQLGTERVFWELPERNVASCRVRAVARELSGRRTVSESVEPFSIDITVPEVDVVSVDSTEKGETRIEFRTTDSGSVGASHVWLYYTQNDGQTWKQWPEPFSSEDDIVLDLPSGKYGFVLRAEDAVGNLAAAPEPGSQPHFEKLVGATRGVAVSLLNPHGGVVSGGSRHYVFWQVDAAYVPFEDRPVRVEYRYVDDDEWLLVADQLPLTGKTSWRIPDREGRAIELRVVAQDLRGQNHMAQSREPLHIDSTIPEVVLVDPFTSNHRPTVVRYRLADPDSLESVELWLRAVSTPEWRLAAEAPVGERLLADIPDGMYRVELVGVDTAGNRGKAPTTGDKGQGDLLVDTVPPLLQVDGIGDRTKLFRESEWLVLRPRVQDRHLHNFPVDFRISADGGASFQILKEYHTNGDDFPIRLPDKPGTYQIEVSARDLGGNTAVQMFPVQVIPTAPTVVLLTNPKNAVLTGGQDLYLEWESRGVDATALAMIIEFSSDGEVWQTVARDLPAVGKTSVPLPRIDSNRCRLRLTVSRQDGLVGRVESGFFTVSTTTPGARVQGARPSQNK